MTIEVDGNKRQLHFGNQVLPMETAKSYLIDDTRDPNRPTVIIKLNTFLTPDKSDYDHSYSVNYQIQMPSQQATKDFAEQFFGHFGGNDPSMRKPIGLDYRHPLYIITSDEIRKVTFSKDLEESTPVVAKGEIDTMINGISKQGAEALLNQCFKSPDQGKQDLTQQEQELLVLLDQVAKQQEEPTLEQRRSIAHKVEEIAGIDWKEMIRRCKKQGL